MFRNALFALAALLLLGSTSWGQSWAQKMFQTDRHDFGTVARGAKAEFAFTFKNIYLEEVHVSGVRSSCGCTSVSVEQPTLKTYEEGTILAHINSDKFLGRKGATITVTFDKPYRAEVQLQVASYIRSDVVLSPGSVQLDTLDVGQTADRTLTVSYVGRSDWRILEVKCGNPHLSGEILETNRYGGQVTYQLTVHLDAEAPVGYLHDHLLLVTNDYQAREVPVPVEGIIQPGIAVNPAALFMGVLHPGETATRHLVVQSKQPFRITSIACDADRFEITAPDVNEAKRVHLIPVKFVAGQADGRIDGTIRIVTDQGDTAPELSAYAVVSR